MKIKFLSGLAGMDADGAVILFSVGDVIEWDDREAERLVLAGIAEAAESEKPKGKSQQPLRITGR